MTADIPPPNSSRTPDTESARGVVRDALGGFRNLLGLLRSIRVGPQAVGAVVPDVYASCAPMLHALATLLADVPEGCRSELDGYLMREARGVEQTLGRHVGKTMRAKDRLQMERALAQFTRSLEIGVRLLVLLHAVRHRRLVSVDVAELATEEGSLVQASPPATRQAVLTAPPTGTAVRVDASLTAAMLALGAGLLAPAPGSGAFRLDVEPLGTQCRLTLAHGGGEGGRAFTVLEAAPPTRACLEVLASELGCEVTVEKDRVHCIVPLASSG